MHTQRMCPLGGVYISLLSVRVRYRSLPRYRYKLTVVGGVNYNNDLIHSTMESGDHVKCAKVTGAMPPAAGSFATGVSSLVQRKLRSAVPWCTFRRELKPQIAKSAQYGHPPPSSAALATRPFILSIAVVNQLDQMKGAEYCPSGRRSCACFRTHTSVVDCYRKLQQCSSRERCGVFLKDTCDIRSGRLD